MKNASRPRQWLLRVATTALAFVFALPACMTMGLWQDDRSREQLLRAEAPALQVFRLPEDRGARFVLKVDAALAAHLHDLLPQVPATASWLRVTPREHAPSVAILLALAAVQGREPNPWLEVRQDAPGAAPTLFLREFLWLPEQPLAALPGARREPGSLYSTRHFAAACDLEALAAPPADLGEPLQRFDLVHVRMRDDGTPVIARLAWTPLAVLGDVLLLPFEIWWWFAG